MVGSSFRQRLTPRKTRASSKAEQSTSPSSIISDAIKQHEAQSLAAPEKEKVSTIRAVPPPSIQGYGGDDGSEPAPAHHLIQKAERRSPRLSSAQDKDRPPAEKRTAFSEDFSKDPKGAEMKELKPAFFTSTMSDRSEGNGLKKLRGPAVRIPLLRTRSTRSEARRLERAESGAGEKASGSPATEATSSSDGKQGDVPAALVPGSEDISLASLSLVCEPNGKTTAGTASIKSPETLPTSPRLPQPTSKPRSSSRSPTTNPTPTISDSPTPYTASSIPSTLFSFPEFPTPTVLSPPLYNLTRPTGAQWTSTLSTTSRPDQPWAWSTRWTCCACEAQTIVEQVGSCANLACGHARCGRCKLIRG